MKLAYFFSRIRSNKDARIVTENIASLTLLQVCGYVFPLLTFPYLTKVLGAEYFGLIAFAATAIGYFQTFTDWGFQYTAVRDIAQHQDSPEEVSRIFSRVMNARVCLMLLSLLVLLAMLFIVPSFKENSLVLIFTYFIVPGHVLFPDWFFQGIERMKYVTLSNFIFKVVFTILVFVCIHDRSDYLWQPLLTAFGYLVAGVFSMFLIIRKWGYRWYFTSFRQIWETIREGFDIFLNTILPQMYNSFSQLLLMFWAGPTACGLYAAADKFNAIMSQMIQVVSRAFFPFLARRIDKHTLYAKMYITVTALCSLLLIITAPYIIKIFFSDEFVDSVAILRILAVSLLFTALQSVYGTNYLIVQHYDRLLRNINLKMSILGFLISFPLVYYWGVIGAALTVFITRALIGLLAYLKARQIKLSK